MNVVKKPSKHFSLRIFLLCNNICLHFQSAYYLRSNYNINYNQMEIVFGQPVVKQVISSLTTNGARKKTDYFRLLFCALALGHTYYLRTEIWLTTRLSRRPVGVVMSRNQREAQLKRCNPATEIADFPENCVRNCPIVLNF